MVITYAIAAAAIAALCTTAIIFIGGFLIVELYRHLKSKSFKWGSNPNAGLNPSAGFTKAEIELGKYFD